MNKFRPISAGFYYTSGENIIFGCNCRVVRDALIDLKHGLKAEATAVARIVDGIIEVEADIEL